MYNRISGGAASDKNIKENVCAQIEKNFARAKWKVRPCVLSSSSQSSELCSPGTGKYTLRLKGSKRILSEGLTYNPEPFASEEPFDEEITPQKKRKTKPSIKSLFIEKTLLR